MYSDNFLGECKTLQEMLIILFHSSLLISQLMCPMICTVLSDAEPGSEKGNRDDQGTGNFLKRESG